MAIRAVGKNERIRIEIEGVTLLISRITSAERQRSMDKHSKKGQVQERLVMDELLQRHIHGYEVTQGNPNTYIFDDNDEYVAPEDFTPKLILNWPETVKTEIYDKLHENELGQDTRKLEEEGTDRAGNSGAGSSQHINLTD